MANILKLIVSSRHLGNSLWRSIIFCKIWLKYDRNYGFPNDIIQPQVNHQKWSLLQTGGVALTWTSSTAGADRKVCALIKMARLLLGQYPYYRPLIGIADISISFWSGWPQGRRRWHDTHLWRQQWTSVAAALPYCSNYKPLLALLNLLSKS